MEFIWTKLTPRVSAVRALLRANGQKARLNAMSSAADVHTARLMKLYTTAK